MAPMNDSKAEISKEMLASESQDSLFDLCNDLRKRRTALDALLHVHQEEERVNLDDVLAVNRRYRIRHPAKDHSYRGPYGNIRHEEESGSWEAEFWDPRLDGDVRDGTHQLSRPNDDDKTPQRKRWSQRSGDESNLSIKIVDSASYGEVNTEESLSSHREHWHDGTDTSFRRCSSGRRHRSLSRSRRRDGTLLQMDDMIMLGDGLGKSNYDPGDFNFRKNMATSPSTINDSKVVANQSQRMRHHGGRAQTHSLSRSRGGKADEKRAAMLREQRDDAFARLEELLGLQPLEARDVSVQDSVVGLTRIDSLHRGSFQSNKHEKEEGKRRDILTKHEVLEPEIDCDVQGGENRTKKPVAKKALSSKHQSMLSSSEPELSSIKIVGRNTPEETKIDENTSSYPQQSRDAIPSRSHSLRHYRSVVPVSPREHGESVQDENQGTSHDKAGKNDHNSSQEKGKGTSRDTSGKNHDNSEQHNDKGTPHRRSAENKDNSECFDDKATGKSTSITNHKSAGAPRQLNTGRGSHTRSVSRSRVGKGDTSDMRLEHQIAPGHNRSLSRSRRRRSRGQSARSSIREPEPEVKDAPPRQSQTQSTQDAAPFRETQSESDANIVDADAENEGTFRIVAYRAPRPLDGTSSEFVDCGVVRSLQHPVSHLDQTRRNIRPTEDRSGVETNVPFGNSENKEIRHNETKNNEGKNEKFKVLRGFFSSRNLKGKNKGHGEKRFQSDGAVNLTVDKEDTVAKLSFLDQTTMEVVPKSVFESQSVLINPDATVMKAMSQNVVINDAKQRIEEAEVTSMMSTERTRLPTSLPLPKGTRKSSTDLSVRPPGDLSWLDSDSPAARNENSQHIEREGMDRTEKVYRTSVGMSPLDLERLFGMWVARLLDALCGTSPTTFTTEVDDDERDVDSLGDIDYYEYSAARRRFDGFR